MPTGKTGWFVVKGQTVERQLVVGRTKASNSSGSKEIVLFVVILVTVPLIVRSVVACRHWSLRSLTLALALGWKTESWAACS